MKTIGKYQFPEQGNQIECAAWKPEIRRTALARNVLAVAKTRIEGAWSAYCLAVPGQNHDDEYMEVLLSGDKMREIVARVLFPQFDGVPYSH